MFLFGWQYPLNIAYVFGLIFIWSVCFCSFAYAQVEVRPIVFERLLFEESCGLRQSQFEDLVTPLKNQELTDASITALMVKVRQKLENNGVTVYKIAFLASKSRMGALYFSVKSSLCDAQSENTAPVQPVLKEVTLKGVTQLPQENFLVELKALEGKPFDGRILVRIMAEIRASYRENNLKRPYIFFSREELDLGVLNLQVEERE